MAKPKNPKADRAWTNLNTRGEFHSAFAQLRGEKIHGPFTSMYDALQCLGRLQKERDERLRAEAEAAKNVD